MPTEYKLKFTPIASEDLDQIYGYISNNLSADHAASNLMEKIEEQITRLSSFPYSSEQLKDDFLKSKGYRKLIVDNYLIFYVVDEALKLVVIMRVIN